MGEANVVEILILGRDLASGVLRNATGEIDSLGEKVAALGVKMSVMTSAITAGLGYSALQAIQFNENITNSASLLDLTVEAQENLARTLLEMGANSRAGPQAMAASYYTIASTVADATKHMEILTAAQMTAEAGNVSLEGTVTALVSTMNSYNFEADKATYVSDVLSQTVAVGASTMDQFGAAFPTVTGLASSLDISLTEVGGAMAYITTKGFTATVAATQLRAAMLAMLKPNKTMEDALASLGYETGQAALAELGLVGALNAVKDAAGNDLAKALGSSEALLAVTTLSTVEAAEALADFSASLDGATERTRAIQMTSTQAQMDLLKSSISGLSIQIGYVLLPLINRFLGDMLNITKGMNSWIVNNREAFETIVNLAASLAKLGPLLLAIGTAIIIITSPMTYLLGVVALLVHAFNTNFLGIRDVLDQVGERISAAGRWLGTFLAMPGNADLGWMGIWERFFATDIIFITPFERFIKLLFGLDNVPKWIRDTGIFIGELPGRVEAVGLQIVDVFNTVIAPALGHALNLAFNIAFPGIISLLNNIVIPGIADFLTWVQGSGSEVSNSIFSTLTTFIQTRLVPAIDSLTSLFARVFRSAGGLFQLHVVPAFASLMGFFGELWESIEGLPAVIEQVGMGVVDVFTTVIAPALGHALNLALNIALPGFVSLINNVIIPGIQAFLGWIQGMGVEDSNNIFTAIVTFIQTQLIPSVESLIGFFGEVFNGIGEVVQTYIIPAFTSLIGFFSDLWTAVSPTLTFLAQWFTQHLLPAIGSAVSAIGPLIATLAGTVVGLWEVVRPHLLAFANWFLVDVIPAIAFTISELIIPAIETFIRVLTGIWEVVGPALVSFADWFLNSALPTVVGFIKSTVVPIIEGFITVLKNIWLAVSPVIQGLVDWFTTTGWPIIENIFTGVIQPAVDILVGVLKGIWELVEPVIQGMLIWFQNLGPALDTIWSALQSTVDTFVAMFTNIWEGLILPTLEPIIAWFRDTLGPALQSIWDEVIQPVINSFVRIFESIIAQLTPVFDSITTFFSNVFNGIKTNIIDPFVNAILAIPRTVQDIFNTVDRIINGNSRNNISMSPQELLAPGNLINLQGAGFIGGVEVPRTSSRSFRSVIQERMSSKDLGGIGLTNVMYKIGALQTDEEAFIPAGRPGVFVNNFVSQVGAAIRETSDAGPRNEINVNITVTGGGSTDQTGEEIGKQLLSTLRSQGVRLDG